MRLLVACTFLVFLIGCDFENPNKQVLEELAVEVVKDNLGIPEGDLQFDAQLKKPTLEGMQTQPKEPKKPKQQD